MNQKINPKNLPTLLPHNIDWTKFFLNSFPIDLEIGSGRTHFLFDRALHFPERNIVGIEWKHEYIAQANRRILRENITNAAVFHGNARLLVPLLFNKKSMVNVFINFPDPWWKTRHKKRLVINEIFLTALAMRMAENGCIVVQTDVHDLFLFYKHLIDNHQAFKFDESLDENAIILKLKAQTHREKKCIEQGLPIYRGVFRLK